MALKSPPKGSSLYKKKLSDCTEKYQSRLWSPPLGRIGKKHTWEETDLNLVLRKHYELKAAYEASNYDLITEKTKPKQYPQLILPCAALYERHLRDDPEIVPSHKAKRLDANYIKDSVSYLRFFLNTLKENGYKLSHTTIQAVDPDAVALLYQALEHRYQAGEIREISYNRYFTTCKYWIQTLIDEYDYPISNPFKNVTLKTVSKDPQILELSELEQLLAAITPDNGIGFKGKNKQTVNYYRDWIRSYLIISVYIGGRPSEIAALRWQDVQDDYVVLINQKKNRMSNQTTHRNYIYIHPDLAEVLANMRSGTHSEDDYILVPDHSNRLTLVKFVSKAFHHFREKAGIKKPVTLYNLRHTYINALYNLIGEEGLSVHQKKETAIQYYLSKRKKLDLQSGKRLFNIEKSLYN